ncbi:MAG: endonuclease, partial [Actinomycetota bacterium]
MAGLLVSSPAEAVVDPTAPVFINEFHYDDASGDEGEFVEVAGPAGTDLTGWTIEFVNGSNGTVYATLALSGTLADQDDGFGTASFLQAGIQNGSPDGMALIAPDGTVVEFLSYEGSFAAAAGAASGLTSTDIGVDEPGSTPEGSSLGRTGTGSLAGDFAWQGPATATPGGVNTGQDFGGGPVGPADPVINELGISDSSTDNEFAEILGDANADYSAWTLIEIDGDGSAAGRINAVVPIGTTDASGFFTVDPAPAFQNGTTSFLLVTDFTGAAGDDLDTDDDGTPDV